MGVDWRLFKTTPGTIYDRSGNEFDAENTGAPRSEDVPPEADTPRSLDISPGNHLNAGDVADQTGSFSICARIKMDDVSTAGQRIVVKDEGSGNGWALSVGDPGSGAIRFFVRELSVVSTDTPTGTISSGTWHAVVAVFDNANDLKRIYVDGATEAEDTSVTGTPADNTEELGVGADPNDSENTDGKVTDVRVYSRALSGTEASDYANGNAIDSTGLGLHYLMDETEESLIDLRVTDAFNRFARSGKIVLDDSDGGLRSEYPKGTPVKLEVKRDIDSGWNARFGGFVFGTGTDRDTLELEILAHDLWLRRRKIFDSFENVALSSILQDLITQYTPLEWNPDLVNVQNDVTYTRQWQGEALSEAIEELASRSAGEDYGANNNAEFFFRPEETTAASRTFGDGEYYEADFSEEAKREVNRVVLYYGSGSDTGAVAVQDRSSQLELQDDLGAPRPVVIEKTVNFPEISTQATAESKARKILEGETAIRTGELKTWEAFDVEPGDVTSVVVPEQDVDGDYRVAEIEYRWQADETRVRLARNSKGVVDVLSSLSDEVTRIDAKGANANATVNEVIDLSQDIVIDTELEVYTRSVPSDQLLFGSLKGGFGDERVGGGRLGDQRGAPTKVI